MKADLQPSWTYLSEKLPITIFKNMVSFYRHVCLLRNSYTFLWSHFSHFFSVYVRTYAMISLLYFIKQSLVMVGTSNWYLKDGVRFYLTPFLLIFSWNSFKWIYLHKNSSLVFYTFSSIFRFLETLQPPKKHYLHVWAVLTIEESKGYVKLEEYHTDVIILTLLY